MKYFNFDSFFKYNCAHLCIEEVMWASKVICVEGIWCVAHVCGDGCTSWGPVNCCALSRKEVTWWGSFQSWLLIKPKKFSWKRPHYSGTEYLLPVAEVQCKQLFYLESEVGKFNLLPGLHTGQPWNCAIFPKKSQKTVLSSSSTEDKTVVQENCNTNTWYMTFL